MGGAGRFRARGASPGVSGRFLDLRQFSRSCARHVTVLPLN